MKIESLWVIGKKERRVGQPSHKGREDLHEHHASGMVSHGRNCWPSTTQEMKWYMDPSPHATWEAENHALHGTWEELTLSTCQKCREVRKLRIFLKLRNHEITDLRKCANLQISKTTRNYRLQNCELQNCETARMLHSVRARKKQRARARVFCFFSVTNQKSARKKAVGGAKRFLWKCWG